MRGRYFYGWVIVAVTAIGLDYIATVPPTVALVADNFGRHNVGIVYGWVAAVAALAAGIVREHVGDYTAAFVAAGWIAIIAGFAALAIRRGRSTPATPATPAASGAVA